MSLLPVSNLLFTVGFTVAERVLYIPSIGSSAILARFLLQLGRQGHSQGHWQGHRQGVVGVALLLVLFVWSRTCLEHSKVWWTGESLYRSALTANPRNEKLHDLLATRLQNSGGNLEEAIWHAEAAIKLNAGYWHAHATLGQLKLATGSKSLAIEHYKKALLLAERQQLDDVADAPKVRLNLAVMLQDVDVQSAEEHFRRLCTLPSSTQGMAMVIFGAFLESQARGNSSRLAEAATMYESALRAPTGAPESVAHLRLGSVLRKLAKLVGKEPTNPPLEATGAKPTKLQRAKLPERIVSSCSKDSLPLPSLRGSLYQASRCWSKLFRQRSCNLDLDLVRIPGLAPCREAPETFGAGRELLSCLWVAYTEGPSNSEEEFLLSTWQLPATDERSMHHFQQGLKTALAPNSEPLDPGARKWREALAVRGARLTLQGRMEEAKALLQDPRALLPKLATEQLKSGDASVALEAFQAVASLQESAQTHRGLAEAFERLGDKAAAMLHKERAAEFGRTHKSQQKCFLRARCAMMERRYFFWSSYGVLRSCSCHARHQECAAKKVFRKAVFGIASHAVDLKQRVFIFLMPTVDFELENERRKGSELETQRDQLETQLQMLKQALEELESEHLEASAVAEGLRKSFLESEEKCKELWSKNQEVDSKLNEERNAASEQLANLQAQVQAMKDTAHDQDEQLKEKLEQLSEAMRQVAELKEILKERDATIDDYEDEPAHSTGDSEAMRLRVVVKVNDFKKSTLLDESKPPKVLDDTFASPCGELEVLVRCGPGGPGGLEPSLEAEPLLLGLEHAGDRWAARSEGKENEFDLRREVD
eukprot:g1362.t1